MNSLGREREETERGRREREERKVERKRKVEERKALVERKRGRGWRIGSLRGWMCLDSFAFILSLSLSLGYGVSIMKNELDLMPGLCCPSRLMHGNGQSMASCSPSVLCNMIVNVQLQLSPFLSFMTPEWRSTLCFSAELSSTTGSASILSSSFGRPLLSSILLTLGHPPVQPIQPSSLGPLATLNSIASPMNPTLQLPLAIHPPSAYSRFPTAVPTSWPTKTLTMNAVLTRFLALGSMP